MAENLPLTPEPEELLSAFKGELLSMLNIRPGSLFQRPASWLIRAPLLRFCRLFAETDRTIARSGLVAGARRLVLPQLARQIHVRGQEQVPASGPLLVVSNHPGGIDSPSIIASLGRDDLKVIASDVSLLRRLPFVRQHMIFIAEDVSTRMNVIREAVRHLQEGGALLIFPTGLIDPDPGFLESAAEALENWSNSVEIFLRKVPQARLLPTVVSDVLRPAAVNQPLGRLFKERWKRLRLAEILQTIYQLLFPDRLQLEPKISFGQPLRAEDLAAGCPSRRIKECIIEYEKALLALHREAYYPPGGAVE